MSKPVMIPPLTIERSESSIHNLFRKKYSSRYPIIATKMCVVVKGKNKFRVNEWLTKCPYNIRGYYTQKIQMPNFI